MSTRRNGFDVISKIAVVADIDGITFAALDVLGHHSGRQCLN